MPFSKVIVCGGGTMGRGIAQQAAQCGKKVVLFDVNAETLVQAEKAIVQNVEKLVQRQKLTPEQRDDIFARLVYTTASQLCVGDIVIEAIVENAAIKHLLFKNLERVNTAETIICSNTSSLSITQLAGSLQHPERFAGLHFFNPATLMQLVEIVRHNAIDNHIVSQLQEFCIELQKTPVVCSDAPGFIVNRVARHYYLEAMRLKLQHPSFSYTNIDQCLTAHGFKMGAFSLMDLIGLDINYAVSKQVWTDLGMPNRLTPSPLQAEKIAENKLGKKTGEGFYKYETK